MAQKLTKNESLVYQALKGADSALKAYDLLDRLRDKGVRAPMTVYRALDGLTQKGLVHKIDSLNAFVCCAHSRPHTVQAFLRCRGCAKVEEAGAAAMQEITVAPIAAGSGFAMEAARLEIEGYCSDCRDGDHPEPAVAHAH